MYASVCVCVCVCTYVYVCIYVCMWVGGWAVFMWHRIRNHAMGHFQNEISW
jgi:hypothetical protein